MDRTLKALLLASAVMSLAAPAVADTYYFRTKPEVSPPQAFSFDAAANLNPGDTATSAVTRIKGYRNKTASVSGDAVAAFQVCAAADCSDQTTWRTAALSDLKDDFYARVRVTAGAYGSERTATLAVGGTSATFKAASRGKDTTPDAFSFPSVSNANPNEASRSAAVQILGHEGVTLSVSGGSYQICPAQACGAMDAAPVQTGTSAEIANGTWVRLVATPTAFLGQATVTLNAGNTVGTFTSTARAKDTIPDAIAAFPNLTGVVASTDVFSEPRQLVNHDGTQVSVSGTSAFYRICSTSACTSDTGWQTAAATAGRDSWVQMKLTASATPSERRDATLTYGGLTYVWSATTAAGAGTHSISAMGIVDANLRASLVAALGDTQDWVPCFGTGIVGDSCSGGKAMLFLHKASGSSNEFGAYVAGDFAGFPDEWRTVPGFYFTNAATRLPFSSGYTFSHNGTMTATGKVDLNRASGRYTFIPLYNLGTTNPSSYTTNSYNSDGWNAKFMLNGASQNGQGVVTTFTAYKRK
jgi:hypothetical protein